MFAIVQTEKFKLLCVVTDIKAKVNIDFVQTRHMTRLISQLRGLLTILFSSNEARYMINIAGTKNSWKKIIFGNRESLKHKLRFLKQHKESETGR